MLVIALCLAPLTFASVVLVAAVLAGLAEMMRVRTE
jgi:hypothetical protein